MCHFLSALQYTILFCSLVLEYLSFQLSSIVYYIFLFLILVQGVILCLFTVYISTPSTDAKLTNHLAVLSLKYDNYLHIVENIAIF